MCLESINDHQQSGTYAACGFEMHLERKQTQFLIQVYLPTFMFVIVSWVSFLIKPEVVPGRSGLSRAVSEISRIFKIFPC